MRTSAVVVRGSPSTLAAAHGFACRRCGSDLRADTNGNGGTVWICDCCDAGEPSRWRAQLVWYRDRVRVLERLLADTAVEKATVADLRRELALANRLLGDGVPRVRRCGRPGCGRLIDATATKYAQICTSCRVARSTHPCQRCKNPVPVVHVGRGRYSRFCDACKQRRSAQQALVRKTQRTGSLVLSVLHEAGTPQRACDIIVALPDSNPRKVYSALQHLMEKGRIRRLDRVADRGIGGWHYALPSPAARRSV